MSTSHVRTSALICVALALSAGCGGSDGGPEQNISPSLPVIDSGAAAQSAIDSGVVADAGNPGSTDAGNKPATDSGTPKPIDAGAMDSGNPSSADASQDAGASDAGAPGDAAVTSDATTPSASCTANTLKPGDTTVMIMHAGAQRDFLLHVPTGYDGSKPVPLVIDIHGYTSDAAAQARVSGWRPKADKEGFIVANPNGLDNSWNGGSLCCGTSQSRMVDDEGFIRAVVKKISADGCVDPKRVYATGLSNGGAMSHLLACRASDVFAATAPVSMGNGTRPCMPPRPISVVMFRGTADNLVPYNGGTFPSAKADFDQWKMLDGCTGTSTKKGVCETYSGCKANTEVTLCTIQDGMHVIYDQASAAGANVPDTVWETFKRQTLP